MKILTMEQRSPEWFKARAYLPTASRFNDLLTPAQLKPSGSIKRYAAELAAGSMGWFDESYTNDHMQRGIDQEDQIIATYAFSEDCEVERVGFVVSDCGRCGCSPDGLVGDDGGVEVKSALAGIQARRIADGRVPLDYLGQVYGSLFITGRDWWDFVSYHPDAPLFVVRSTREDEAYRKWAEAFGPVLDKCIAERDALIEKIQPSEVTQ